ncbi:RICIN domain-containing protein [Streptomyces caelestis]
MALTIVLTGHLPSAQAAVPTAGQTYRISVAAGNKCLEIKNGVPDDGALLQQWQCTDAAWQRYTLTPSGNGLHSLVSAHTGRCLEIRNGTTAQQTQAQQWQCTGAPWQQWRLNASGNGTYQIINNTSGLCLANQNAGTANGTPIVQETCADTTTKQWLFTPAGSGGRDWPSTPDGFAGAAGTTGGAGGQTVTVSSQADLERYASAGQPYTIRVNGTISVSPYGKEIRVTSNKTVVGVGTSGTIAGGGFFLGEGTSNVIIRNLTIRDTRMADDDPGDDGYDYDGIQMDTANRIWIDHNRIMRMNDGLIDSRKDTTNLTVSWNVLTEGNKAFGIGWTDNVTARMTIHHNWIHKTGPRNPSTDNVAHAHLYNNYLQNITGYGNYSRGSTKMVIENSYYDTVKNPYYPDSTAELRQTGSIVKNSSGKQQTRGSAFDPRSFYSYTLDPASSVPALLGTYAGPQVNIGM